MSNTKSILHFVRNNWFHLILNVACLIAFATAGESQSRDSESGMLPAPTGPFGIGRVTVHLTDNSRLEPLSTDHRNRELMVDIWYPAKRPSGPTAPYLDAAAFERALGEKGLTTLLGARAAELVKAGQVRTHAIEGAPFARSLKLAPLLIFSHGMGTVTQIHTTQIEDLVSHGYVVAAITHSYDAWLTLFPDGRSIPFEREHRKATGSSGEERVAYENTRVEWWANDIRFVIDELSRENETHSAAMPFAGHLDLKRIGAFGHSVGGRAAARACQLDRRIRACANQDGAVGGLPFYVDKDGWGMDQPFLYIMRDGSLVPPTDEELKKMGRTREQDALIVFQHQANREAAMRATGGGSCRIVPTLRLTSHMSFSDLPLLQASGSPAATTPLRTLDLLNRYTREFFDKTLRGMKAPLLDGDPPSELVEQVEKFPPASAPKNLNAPK